MTESQDIELDLDEEKTVRQRSALRSPVIYEIIRREGEEELERPAISLCWSGLAAGIAIGFSVLGEAILRAYLPDMPYRHLIENVGYSFGFVFVILARLQLFTENTITVVLPVLLKPSWSAVARTGRLWAIVLCANVVGGFLFAVAMVLPGALLAPVSDAALGISIHMMENSVWEMFVKGIFSGWLIAGLVWMMPNAKNAGLWLIILVTYLIAAGDFTHIVAGSVEMFLVLLKGTHSLNDAVFGFFLPVLAGNILGGTGLFAMLTYGQVSQEIDS